MILWSIESKAFFTSMKIYSIDETIIYIDRPAIGSF